MANLRRPDLRERKTLRSTLGLRCLMARERLGLSQGTAARIMGYSRSWISQIECGRQFAPWWYVAALSKATGHPTAWFCKLDTVPAETEEVR